MPLMASDFTAGSGKSVLWYVVLQAVMYNVTYDIS
jgi:hypothetical protein